MGRKTVVEKKLEAVRAAKAAEVDAKAWKFDSAARERYLALLRKGGRRYASAKAVGVTGDYVRRVRKADPMFDEACIGAELEGLEPVEGKLIEAAMDREPWAVKMALAGRDPERWGEKRTVSVEVSGSIELEVGERLAAVRALEAALKARAALGGAAVLELEGVEE